MLSKLKNRFRSNAQTAQVMADGVMAGDERAQTSAMQVVGLVVSLTVGAIIASFLLPIGLDEITSVDTTNYSDGAGAMWGILDVIIVLSLFLFFVAIALASADRV